VAASAETAQTAGGSGCAQCYTVKSGDTLSKIARTYGTTVNTLVALNGIANPDQIAVGTTICVKAKGSQPGGKYYTVKSGDTLYSVARKFGWTASYLAQVNTIPNPDEIYAGRVLWIPAH
jgi:LysM repeat protein